MKEAAPGTYTRAIMIGDDLDHDTTNSVFMSADNQVCTRNPYLIKLGGA